MRFLHLLRPRPDDALLGELLRGQSDPSPAIDAILLAGDFAESGKAAEYEPATAFLREVLRATGVPKEHVFAVPGDGDADPGVGRWLLPTLGSREQAADFFGDAANRESHARKFRVYRAALGSVLGEERPLGLACGAEAVEWIESRGQRIAVASFNSAWFARGDGHGEGRWVGAEQIARAARAIADQGEADCAVALLSHGPAELHPLERAAVEEALTGAFDLVLRGDGPIAGRRAAEFEWIELAGVCYVIQSKPAAAPVETAPVEVIPVEAEPAPAPPIAPPPAPPIAPPPAPTPAPLAIPAAPPAPAATPIVIPASIAPPAPLPVLADAPAVSLVEPKGDIPDILVKPDDLGDALDAFLRYWIDSGANRVAARPDRVGAVAQLLQAFLGRRAGLDLRWLATRQVLELRRHGTVKRGVIKLQEADYWNEDAGDRRPMLAFPLSMFALTQEFLAGQAAIIYVHAAPGTPPTRSRIRREAWPSARMTALLLCIDRR